MASLQTLKALWVGEPGVGKSRSLWYLYNNDILKEEAFQYASCPTFDESLPVTTFVNGRIHAISVWDSAGGDDHGRLRTLSYPVTHVFVLVFSFSNPSSLQKILSVYLPEVMSYAPEGGPDTSFILVGNKTDLWDSSPSHLPRNPFVDPAVFAAWRCTVLCVLRRCAIGEPLGPMSCDTSWPSSQIPPERIVPPMKRYSRGFGERRQLTRTGA